MTMTTRQASPSSLIFHPGKTVAPPNSVKNLPWDSKNKNLKKKGGGHRERTEKCELKHMHLLQILVGDDETSTTEEVL